MPLISDQHKMESFSQIGSDQVLEVCLFPISYANFAFQP